MSKAKTPFKVNQKIVYPSQGVGKIIEIKEKVFNILNMEINRA